MCGRFTLTVSPATLLGRLGVTNFPKNWTPRYNFCPGQMGLVVTQDREATSMKWGLVPYWAKDPKIGYTMINARAETLANKPSFRQLLSRKRGILPADSFFEWKLEGKTKQGYRILLETEEVFAMAGLWDTWKTPEGESLQTFTIITTEACPSLETLHHRMPVILTPAQERLWVSQGTLAVHEMKEILSPYRAGQLSYYPVSKWVNSPKNDAPECIERAQRSENL